MVMAAPATEAIIFDCIGVLYKNNESLFHGQELNSELIDFISNSLRPSYKIGLLSNIDRKWIDNFFEKHQLKDLFDTVIVSGDEGITKPDPVIYQRMCVKLGAKPDSCIMIDDLKENCIGAESIGMQSILFTSNEKLFEEFMKNEYLPIKY